MRTALALAALAVACAPLAGAWFLTGRRAPTERAARLLEGVSPASLESQVSGGAGT